MKRGLIAAAVAVCLSGGLSAAVSDGVVRLGDGRRGVFSPDGKRIAFEAKRAGGISVGVMPAAGGAVRWLNDGPGNAGQPAWSPDGALVYIFGRETQTALSAARAGSAAGGVNLFRRKEAACARLTQGRVFDYTPSVAPDGTVWFVTTRGEAKCTVRDTGLCKAHIASMAPGETAVQIRRQYKKSNTGAMQPVVSPDGSVLLWAEMRGFRGNWRIYAARLDNLARMLPLTPPEAACHSPRWSPDGRRICYTGYRVGDPGWCVYVQDLQSGRESRVCEGRNPCFSPDGSRLVYDDGEALYLRPAPPLPQAARPKPGRKGILPRGGKETR
jgi:Tol biopolymer transport system component